MNRLLRLLQGNRRGGAREDAQRPVHLFDGDQRIGTALLIEESPGGARLSMVGGAQPPDDFVFVEVETALAHAARVAWRNEGLMGVSVAKSQRLRGYVPPEFTVMKRFWEEAAVLKATG